MMKSVLVLLVLTAVASSYRLNGFKDLLSRKKLIREVKDEVLREFELPRGLNAAQCDVGERRAEQAHTRCIRSRKLEFECMYFYRIFIESLMNQGCDDLTQTMYGKQKKRK